MRKLLAISNLLLVIGLLLNSPVGAQFPSPEASPAGEEVIDEKIKDVRDWAKEKAREMIEEAKKGRKKAFVGKISEIANTNLVIDTHLGEKQAKTDEETKIIGLGKKEIEFEDLEIGSFVIAMGYLEETGVLNARRIVISKRPKVPARLVAFGKVTDKSPEEEVLTVKHPSKGTIWTVEVRGTTKITKKIEVLPAGGQEKVEKIKFDQIELGDRLVAIGVPDKEENFLIAKLIHIIPFK